MTHTRWKTLKNRGENRDKSFPLLKGNWRNFSFRVILRSSDFYKNYFPAYFIGLIKIDKASLSRYILI